LLRSGLAFRPSVCTGAEDRQKRFFVSFDYTSDALTEIDRFFWQIKPVMIPFTVQEILDERIAQKLA
jgi:hypothetical protein